MILINSLWTNWARYYGFLLNFSLWNLISKLAPFSTDGKRELCHFLFCQLLAKKKLNKSENLSGRKQMSHSSKGLTSCSSMIYTISQDEPECSASACCLHRTWWAVLKNVSYVIDSCPKSGFLSTCGQDWQKLCHNFAVSMNWNKESKE